MSKSAARRSFSISVTVCFEADEGVKLSCSFSWLNRSAALFAWESDVMAGYNEEEVKEREGPPAPPLFCYMEDFDV